MWSEPRLSPKEEALAGMRRRLAERRWRGVLEVAEQRRHVSLDYLIELMVLGSVPQFATAYAADRFSGKVKPAGRPARPPLDPGDPDTLWDHFDGGDIPWRRPDSEVGVEDLYPSQFHAVWAVRKWAARYAALESQREPRRPENRIRMSFVKSRRVWRVKDPKGEARRRVAAIWGVLPKTLALWERRITAYQRAAASLLQAKRRPGSSTKHPQF